MDERVTSGVMEGCVLGVSNMSQWGEQLDWGAATLPTLSTLSRINDNER